MALRPDHWCYRYKADALNALLVAITKSENAGVYGHLQYSKFSYFGRKKRLPAMCPARDLNPDLMITRENTAICTAQDSDDEK